MIKRLLVGRFCDWKKQHGWSQHRAWPVPILLLQLANPFFDCC